MMGPSDLVSELVQLAESACRGANDVLSQRFGASTIVGRKGDLINVVTDADLESELSIVELIRQSRPDDGFMAEESEEVSGSSGITWVIDPLDSTANFARGIPIFSVSIAACDEAGPMAAAVGHPREGIVYSSGRGTGGVRVYGGAGSFAPAAIKPLAPRNAMALFGLGPRETAEHPRATDVPAALFRNFGKVRSPGSPALGLAWVAVGIADIAYYEMDFSDWDIAAGSLLCAEAGCTVIERPKLAQGLSRRILAGRPELVELIRSDLGI